MIKMITEAIQATKLSHTQWMEKQSKQCESIYIYNIYIYIEREREREIDVCRYRL